MNLKLLKRTEIYKGRVFDIIADEVEYPSGNKTVREVARHAGGGVALAVFPDRRVILIRQHRYPFDEFVWELPAGKLFPGEEPLRCAQRELAEETGWAARRWKKLTAMYTTPGFCSEVLHIFMGTDLHELPEGRSLEEGEQTMTTEILPMSEAIAMIERNEIVDSKTICGLLLGERAIAKEQ
jgi:ADP-ribose pyrophosphatase